MLICLLYDNYQTVKVKNYVRKSMRPVHILENQSFATLVFSWMHVHAEHVIVEKLAKLTRTSPVATPWVSAISAYAVEKGVHKWSKLARRLPEPVCLFTETVTRSAIRLKGAVSWLEPLTLLAAEGSLRIRPEDVLSVGELAKTNVQYRNRLLFGACWRADIVTAIQSGASTATDIMSQIGCSYEPAHRVRREYLLATAE